MKLSEAVNRVIQIGSRIREYYEIEVPKRLKNYPLVSPGEEEPPPPPEEKELRDFLVSLPGELIYQLTLIEHLGRGSAHADDLATYYASLQEIVGNREQAAQQLIWNHAVIADELSDGLDELRKLKINVDRLPLTKVKAQKR
jgi:hypothetical protein